MLSINPRNELQVQHMFNSKLNSKFNLGLTWSPTYVEPFIVIDTFTFTDTITEPFPFTKEKNFCVGGQEEVGGGS